MQKRKLALAALLVVAATATGIATATAATPSGNQGSAAGTATPAAQASSPATATIAPPEHTYRSLPKIWRGMKRTVLTQRLRERNFRATFRSTYGKKNAVLSFKVSKYWNRPPRRKLDPTSKWPVYRDNTELIVTVGNGKQPPRPWHTGVATWYSIADNTPAGSRTTSSGHPLGSFSGFTFASLRFPMGTKLRIKHAGRTRVVTCTDRGGLHTIDLYKPASNYFHMDGMSSFKYQVVRRGW